MLDIDVALVYMVEENTVNSADFDNKPHGKTRLREQDVLAFVGWSQSLKPLKAVHV
jgi:hypothetical protein